MNNWTLHLSFATLLKMKYSTWRHATTDYSKAHVVMLMYTASHQSATWIRMSPACARLKLNLNCKMPIQLFLFGVSCFFFLFLDCKPIYIEFNEACWKKNRSLKERARPSRNMHKCRPICPWWCGKRCRVPRIFSRLRSHIKYTRKKKIYRKSLNYECQKPFFTFSAPVPVLFFLSFVCSCSLCQMR